MAKIQAVVMRPGEAPKAIRVENSLRGIQRVIGGDITLVRWKSQYSMYADDEGLLRDLPFNVMVGAEGIVGPVLVTGYTADGEERSLTPEEVEEVIDALSKLPREPCVVVMVEV